MVLIDTNNLRDVVAFPKTQRGQDLLMQSPSEVAADQLRDLALRVVKPRNS
jgi:aspartyl-tRNA synthetase